MRPVAFAATAAFALSLGGAEAASMTPDYAETCAADVRTSDDARLVSLPGTIGRQICKATIGANNYWEEHGFPSVADVPVIYLQKPTDTYNCGLLGEVVAVENDENTAQYCPDNKVIIVSDASITHRLLPGDTPEMQAAEASTTIDHEEGHAVQDASGQQFFIKLSQRTANKRNEQQADCLAGRVMQAETPEYVTDAAVVRGRVLNNADKRGRTHGTSAERQAVLMYGASGADCDYTSLQAAGHIPKLSPYNPEIQVQATYAEPR